MRNLLIIFQLLILGGCATSQGYSTSNAKAIKLFEEALETPRLSKDPVTFRPNFRGAIDLLEKAIDKDPKFWEAEVYSAELYMELFDYTNAIIHFENALAINPNHSSTGLTYFDLANAQYTVGDYENAIRNIDIYVRYKNSNPELVNQAYIIRASCEFSDFAMKHPSSISPINIGPEINTKDPEYFPTITVDGKTILFTRRIYDENAPADPNPNHDHRQENFYISELGADGKWGNSVPMPGNINTVNNEGAPTLAPDGRSLIFVACSAGPGEEYGPGRTGKGSCDLFFTKKLGNRWMNPVNLPGNVNSGTWETQPSISSDGMHLYFIRRVSKKGEPINSDIFVSTRLEDGTWGTAERLPSNINTPMEEESVLIHPDGKTLYFASRGHVGLGGSDLYVTRLDDKGNWSNPENLGYPINSRVDENSLMVSPEGNIAFFASDREGGYGDLDIYYFELPEKLRPTKTLYFEGKVFDAVDRTALPGKFRLIDINTGKDVIVSEADKMTGEFMVALPVNKEYALNVSYPGYTSFSQNFNMTNPAGLEAIHMDVPMIPITNNDLGTALKNVFFDFEKATLRPESYVELNTLVAFLNQNPRLKIEIGGHTDTRGDAQKNLILSDNRAKSVVEYLVSKGIAKERLTSKGFGETMPIITDEKIASFATEKEKEAAHQDNRRTEYKILK